MRRAASIWSFRQFCHRPRQRLSPFKRYHHRSRSAVLRAKALPQTEQKVCHVKLGKVNQGFAIKIESQPLSHSAHRPASSSKRLWTSSIAITPFDRAGRIINCSLLCKTYVPFSLKTPNSWTASFVPTTIPLRCGLTVISMAFNTPCAVFTIAPIGIAQPISSLPSSMRFLACSLWAIILSAPLV